MDFNKIAPVFGVRDVAESIEFYERQLGFRLVHAADDPPVYAVLARDEIGIHLKRDAVTAGKCSCWIIMQGVDALFALLQKAGVTIVRAIEDSSYGLRDFVIADVDGNELGIREIRGPMPGDDLLTKR
jgi:predicted enzyme related to lactoylglutathione lyase